MTKITWHKEEHNIWVGDWRYWIKYENNKFTASAFNEGVETSYKPCNTLKQAKAWCAKKERKRLKPIAVIPQKAVCVDTGVEYDVETVVTIDNVTTKLSRKLYDHQERAVEAIIKGNI